MHMTLSLIKNSDDYLNESIHNAMEAAKNTEKWKYAILNIVQSIELCLKERLRIEHPCLIYENVDKQNNTVSIEKALERLIHIANINIKKSDIESIKLAKDWRNALTHYEFDYDIDAVKLTYIKLFGFLNEFNELHFDRLLKTILKDELWDTVTSYYQYSKELGERAKEVIKRMEYKKIWHCNECGEETFIIDEGLNTCLSCKHSEEILVCEQCGTYVFKSESHQPYLGIITTSNNPEDIGKKLQPILCEYCYEDYKKSNEEI